MKIDDQLKTIDKITDGAIVTIKKDREEDRIKGKRPNYFIEMLKYCEIVTKKIRKYLN